MQPYHLTEAIIRAGMKVHSALGPGLLESAYRACMKHELKKAGLNVQTEVPLPINYDGICLDIGYRMDLVVEDLVVVELKAVAKLSPLHDAQILSHLKLSQRPIGLLMNFHVLRLRNGIKRFVNNAIKAEDIKKTSANPRALRGQ
jgi:GxxExxY protein